MESSALQLIGLDFGSTTSSALVLRARVSRNCVTGRMALEAPVVHYRSPAIFTPFLDDALDTEALRGHVRRWLGEAGVRREEIAGGGAIVTGLAAERAHAESLRALVADEIGEALIATAGDPHLESWLAFKGSCDALSRSDPDRWIVNLDIGGGTTNVAAGRDGEVAVTGCWFLGARHVEVEPGTYRITRLSSYARELFAALGIRRGPGETLLPAERSTMLAAMVRALEGIVGGDGAWRREEELLFAPVSRFELPAGASHPALTFSGGVGELVYRRHAGLDLPATTAFGDLGIDLAESIAASPILSRSLGSVRPETLGRATVFGLALHNVDVSGTTLYLPDPDVLPLRDLPVLARLTGTATQEALAAALERVKQSPRGGCIALSSAGPSLARELGRRLAHALEATAFPPDIPLVFLMDGNGGKTLGSYASGWGKLPVRLIVIDEVEARHAQFVGLGAMFHSVVTLSFYGR